MDEFYETIQGSIIIPSHSTLTCEPVGAVYTFADGRVKVANRQFTQIKNEYEISFDKKAIIQRVEDQGDISRVSIVAVPIASIAQREAKVLMLVFVLVDSQVCWTGDGGYRGRGPQRGRRFQFH